MKKLLSLSLLISAIFILSSCNDDFLDRVPETEIGAENFFNTEADLDLYINNLYNFPGWRTFYDGDAATDNASFTGNKEWKTIMTTDASSNSIQSGWTWGRLRDINFFLENFNKANISQERLNHFEGLARFFRANFYMNKVARFSDVPWYDQTIGTADVDQLEKPRDARDFVIDRVFEDLEFAVNNVGTNEPSGAINRWVVKAYMARHALYEGTFRKYHPELNLENTADRFLQIARDASKDIIDNGGFALHNTGNPDADYIALFTNVDLGGNSEIIYNNISIPNVKNSGASETVFGNFEGAPAKDLVQSYLNKDGSFYTDDPDFATNLFVEEFENRDPRLSQTYAFPGWILYNVQTYAQGTAGLPYIQQLNKNFPGYHQIKGFMNFEDQDIRRDKDIPVLRYAETLLIYAEAKAELGELTQADLDLTINDLRARVDMPVMTLSPKVDPIQEARYPLVKSATAQWAELLEIRRERRVELAFEGFRLDDLMRWSAGKLLEAEPQGLYFPGLGKYDLIGDGVDDIILIDVSETIPASADKEVNALGELLIYYRASVQGGDGGVYLENGTSGNVQTIIDRGTFQEPKHYYRPIPSNQVALNPNLTQMFGWN